MRYSSDEKSEAAATVGFRNKGWSPANAQNEKLPLPFSPGWSGYPAATRYEAAKRKSGKREGI